MSNPRSGRRDSPIARVDRRTVIQTGLATIAASIGAISFTRTGKGEPEPVARNGGNPIVALARLPIGEDIPGARRPEEAWVSSLCHDTLFAPNEAGELVSAIALSPIWSPDRRELTFGVRQGVIFPDGTQLTAADIVASLEHARTSPVRVGDAWRLEHVESVEVVDPQTLRLILTQPDSSIPACISAPSVPILSASVVASLRTFNIAEIPPGSGPFTPGAVLDGGTFQFNRNRTYWQPGRPHLDGVTVTSIEEDNQRTIALVTNSVDMMIDAPLLDIPSLQQDPNITLVGGPSVRACVLLVNVQSGGMADRRLRLLLSRTIDRSALVKAATGNEASAEQTLFPKASWPGLDQPPEPTDWAQSKTDLVDLGYPIGTPLRLIADERDGSAANAAVVMQEQLSYAGFSLTLDLLDEPALRRALASRDYDLYITYTPTWTDPHELVRPLLMTDGPDNLMGYRSARVDLLIRRGVMIHEQDNRAEVYRLLQQVLLDELPLIVLFFPNYYDAMSSSIKDFRWYPPVRALGLRTAWMERTAAPG